MGDEELDQMAAAIKEAGGFMVFRVSVNEDGEEGAVPVFGAADSEAGTVRLEFGEEVYLMNRDELLKRLA